MTGWSDFRCAVETAAERCVCDKNVVVQWEDDGQMMGTDQMRLSVVSAVPIYNREERSGDPITESFSSMLQITVQFRAEAIHSPNALDIAERVRINLRRYTTREALRTAGVTFVGFPSAVRPLSYSSDRRIIHTHYFETSFNFVFTAETETIDQINQVDLGGTVTTPGDVDIDIDFTVDEP